MFKNMRMLVLSVLILMLSGCASGYKTFYKPMPQATSEVVANRRVSPPPEIPIVERTAPGDPNAIVDSYIKRGYLMIGSSSFYSDGKESEESAIRQGQDAGADLVLIINPTYKESNTSIVPITTPTTNTSYSTGTATAYGPYGPVTAYGIGTTTTYGTTTNYVPVTRHVMDYAAVYFIKAKFNLGAIIRNLNETERQALQSNKGVAVTVLVDGSPAFNADVLVGDIITMIDGITISNEESYGKLTNERNGKLIKLSILRGNQHIEKSIQLNMNP